MMYYYKNIQVYNTILLIVVIMLSSHPQELFIL